jgi:hypothetical protein
VTDGGASALAVYAQPDLTPRAKDSLCISEGV